jgi:hypothetical protein
MGCFLGMGLETFATIIPKHLKKSRNILKHLEHLKKVLEKSCEAGAAGGFFEWKIFSLRFRLLF